jgi:hypothetical protein
MGHENLVSLKRSGRMESGSLFAIREQPLRLARVKAVTTAAIDRFLFFILDSAVLPWTDAEIFLALLRLAFLYRTTSFSGQGSWFGSCY